MVQPERNLKTSHSPYFWDDHQLDSELRGIVTQYRFERMLELPSQVPTESACVALGAQTGKLPVGQNRETPTRH
jgi:hypothetical protein